LQTFIFKELSAALKTAPGKLYAVKCDVTKEADVKEAFKWVKTNLGGVDILVNNAGGDSSNTLIGKSRFRFHE
jgi:NADP+-dependent farnesol dehydrogenase